MYYIIVYNVSLLHYHVLNVERSQSKCGITYKIAYEWQLRLLVDHELKNIMIILLNAELREIISKDTFYSNNQRLS